MVDYTKFDFAKFDVTKMFDVDAAITAMEKNNKLVAGLIMDERARTAAETISAASCAFVRAQVAAAKEFGTAVKKAVAV